MKVGRAAVLVITFLVVTAACGTMPVRDQVASTEAKQAPAAADLRSGTETGRVRISGLTAHDENEAFVFGELGFHRTLNGGVSWEQITAPPPGSQILDVALHSEGRHWILLQQDGAVRVARLGSQSSDVTSSLGQFGPASGALGFVSDRDGWLALDLGANANFTHSLLFGTSDGGHSWKPLTSPAAVRVHFVDEGVGFAAGNPKGELFRTVDGGQSWTLVRLQPPNSELGFALTYDVPIATSGKLLLPVSFTDETDSGMLWFESVDLGAHWVLSSRMVMDGVQASRGVSFPISVLEDGRHVFAGAPDGSRMFRSTNGGQDWEVLAPNGVAAFHVVEFVTSEIGWAVEAYGACLEAKSGCRHVSRVLRTTSRGQTWEDVTPG